MSSDFSEYLPLIGVLIGFFLNYFFNEKRRAKEEERDFQMIVDVIEEEFKNAKNKMEVGFTPFKFSTIGRDLLRFRIRKFKFSNEQIESIIKIYGNFDSINSAIDNWFRMEIGGNLKKDDLKNKITEFMKNCNSEIEEYFKKIF